MSIQGMNYDALRTQQLDAQTKMQAVQDQARVNADYGRGQTAAPKVSDHPLTVLEVAQQHAQRTTHSLVEISVRLAALRERVFGPEPPEAASEGASTSPSGAMNRLSVALAPHESLIARIHSFITDLDRIA